MDKEKDTIECLTVDVDGNGQKIKETYTALLESMKVPRAKVTLKENVSGGIPIVITEYLLSDSTPDYDFVILGSKGVSANKKQGVHYLGTVAESVMLKARTNLILVVKNS